MTMEETIRDLHHHCKIGGVKYFGDFFKALWRLGIKHQVTGDKHQEIYAKTQISAI